MLYLTSNMAIDYTKIDNDALRLTKAMRQVESGGNANAVGDNGNSKGAYQWQPGNYEAMAKQYGIDPTDRSLPTQNKVAYSQVKDWKDKGYSADQIAAAWNMGSSTLGNDKWKTNKGYNKEQGYAYDTPAHVAKVKSEYLKLKESEGLSQPVQAMEDPTPTSETNTDNLGEKIYKGVVGAFTDPAATLYGGARNLITGEDNPTVRNVLTGENTQALGYDKQGNELSTGQTIAQGAGAAVQLIPQTKILGLLGKAGKIAKLGINPITADVGVGAGKMFATGATMMGGEELRNINAEDSATETGLKTAGMATVGGALAIPLGIAGSAIGKVASKLGKSPIVDQIAEATANGDLAKVAELRASKEFTDSASVYGMNSADDIAIKAQKERDNLSQLIQDTETSNTKTSELRDRLSKNEGNEADKATRMVQEEFNGKGEKSFDGIQSRLESTASKIAGDNSTIVEKLSKSDLDPFKHIDEQAFRQSVFSELPREYVNEADAFARVSKIIDSKLQANAGKFDIGVLDSFRTLGNKSFEGDSFTSNAEQALARASRSAIDKVIGQLETNGDTTISGLLKQYKLNNEYYATTKLAKQIAAQLGKILKENPDQVISKGAGFLTAMTATNPLLKTLGYYVSKKMTDRAQRSIARNVLETAMGGQGSKFSKTLAEEQGMNTSKFINDLANKTKTNKASASNEKVKQEAVAKLIETLDRNKRPLLGTGSKQAISPTPMVVNPTTESDVTRGFTDSKSLPSSLRGMNTPETMAALAGTGALGVEAYNKWKEDGKYTAEQPAPEEPFMKPIVNEHVLSPKEEKAAKSVPASMIDTVKKAMEHTGMNLDKVINHMKAENGGSWDPKLVGHADPTDRGVTQLNPMAIGILEGTTGPKIDFFKQNFGHKFDINNVNDQILGYATYMNWLKQYALPEQGIKNPTNNDAMLAYNLGAKGLSEIKNKTADATTTARYARYYSLLKQNDALD